MEENNNKSSNKIVIIILAVLLLGAVGYMFWSRTEHQKVVAHIKDEKTQLIENLKSEKARYETLEIANDSLQTEYQATIASYDEQIAELSKKNDITLADLKKYKNRYWAAKKKAEKLEKENERIKKENELLKTDLETTKADLESQSKLASDLGQEKSLLEGKIAIGARLSIDNVQIVAMKERSNGKLKLTTKSRTTDVFRISCLIRENLIATSKELDVYIEILGPNGAPVETTGNITIEDGTVVEYIDHTSVLYEKEDLEVVSAINVDRKKITKGVYTANIYLEGRLVGSQILQLK
ncbi:hypothetical protein [Aureivirga marina]|uniref:hypothetical protein n=1 Tax=Aureivirga marina TaxID=1182451 RepID=UPI0018CB23D4|nr:hypothetical protein [Aureivirga marina]